MAEAGTREALLERIWELAERAASAWPLERPRLQLLEHKKNVTFKIEEAPDGPARQYVLRVCDPDGYGEAEIRSELQYLQALGQASGLLVPRPVRSRGGALVVRGEAEGLERPRWCALFQWVPGRRVGDAPTPQRLEQVGEIAGRLHLFSEEWLPPPGFSRPRWDAAGLFGDGPVLAPGQGAPVVSERARDLLDEAAGVVRETMAALGEGREVFGLVHKDLEPDNTLVDGERVHAIDFADLGWGYYLYDIAAALLPLREKPGFAAMREAFLRGYRRVRPLADEHAGLLDTFFIARGIFSARLMTGRLWDLPKIREYAETAVPQILGGIRIFLERRRARTGGAAAADATRTTVQVLSLLRSRGVKLWAEGEKLRYNGPPGALTAELLAELKERKEELLGFLRQGQAARRPGAPARIEAAHPERPPLSFAQQRLWLLHQLAPESAEHNIARAVRLRGRVRVDLLAASLREIVRRHGALRTTFAVDGGRPVQVVAPHPAIPLPLVDLAGLPGDRREAEAWRLAQEDAARPFDLARGPLLRVFLLRLEAEDFIAPSTMHHAVGDGWSSGILFREMGLVYGALAAGAPPVLPPLPVQYVDFAVWQRQWLTGEVLDEQLAWWRQQLAGAPHELGLPTDRPRPASHSSRGDRRPLLIPGPLAESLRTFSQAQGATLFMILLAAWKTLLCRLSGQDDVVVGSPVANRNRTEIQGLIGCFVNPLALRTVFPRDPTFREVLAAVRRTALGAYAHQDLPFELIAEELCPERHLTRTPLFQVIFTLQNVPSPDLETADFRMTLMPPAGRAAMFDLSCNMKEMPEGVRTSFMYREDLFDGTTVQRLADSFLRLLEAVAADPDQRIRELPLLSPAEERQLLKDDRDDKDDKDFKDKDSMTETAPPIFPTLASPAERMFPTLTPPQIARIAAHGSVRPVRPGEILVEAGDHAVPFYVVTSGRVEIVRPFGAAETLVAVHGPGQFSGEVSMLSGRRALVRARATEPGEVIQMDRERLLSLVQTDAELGEILMRAFILRRVELIAQGMGDVVLLGSAHCAGTLRVREFLTRNGHPHTYIDLDREAGVQDLLDQFHVSEADVPVLICRGDVVLRNPTNEQIADCLGLNDPIDPAQIHDLVIVGAGPSGLAAAVYGASEGLDVLVLESSAPGGQAASSSKIENYLGFPTGISGQELAGRAYTQAQKFGAHLMVAKGARRLACERKPYAIEIDGGQRVLARTVVLATGAEYRKLGLENLPQFEGAGVYYGATFMEAQLCGGEEVIVVGGGNSAGQAAVFLAQTARRVHVLIRSGGLAESMSRYLIRRIEDNPAIVLRTRTEITALEGDDHLERVRWRDASGNEETHDIRHIFVMTGASPSTQWLGDCVALDAKGFIKTGPDLSREDLDAAEWPLARPPHLLETSLPGVFAVGDVRGGNIKRVASAVGEGSIAVAFVHQVLHE